MKNCTKCKTLKEASEYFKDRSNHDGLQSFCKSCAKVANTKIGTDGLNNRQRALRKIGTDGLTGSQRQEQKIGPDGLTREQRKGADGLTRSQRRSRKRGADGLTALQRHRRGNPVALLGYHLKKEYGITVEEFDEMILTRGGMCDICEKSAKLCVDHDHNTGKIRGLLCSPCNVSLGGFKDSLENLTAAVDYLKKHL